MVLERVMRWAGPALLAGAVGTGLGIILFPSVRMGDPVYPPRGRTVRWTTP